jgi:ribosomal-protein-alanine N-acetyltransferase
MMPEALRAAITFGFDQILLHRIEAFVDPANWQSQRVLEKLGFHRDGVLRDYGYWKGRFWDEACYSLLAPEWTS